MDDREERDRMKASYEDRVRVLADTVSQRERELAILAHVASRVHGENEVQAILDIALDEILERMDLETAWIFMGTDDELKLTLAASRGEKMKQVVMNLVRNAVEAMPEGGAVTLESGLVDGRARLIVRDTGPGLPAGVDV